MQRSRLRIAAAFAALGAVPPAVLAQSESDLLQSPRRAPWALVAERALWDAEQPPALRASPGSSGISSADPGWLRGAEFKPVVQLDLAQGWALCADWDRARPKAAQLRESIDNFLLGLQYKFR